MANIDDLFTEVHGVQLPNEVAADWGFASPVPEVTLPAPEPAMPQQPGPPITNWNQVTEPPADTEDTYNFAPEDLTQHVSQGAEQLASGGRGSLSVKARIPGRAEAIPEDQLDPGQEADLATVFGTRMDALMQRSDAEQGMISAEEEARQATVEFNERDAREGEDRRRSMEAQRLMREDYANQMAMQDEADIEAKRQAIRSVDPARRWKEATAFQKAAGYIGAFLGGFMEPVTGKNTALQTIMQIIDNDIRAQMMDIETQREDVYRQERAAERKQGRVDRANARAYEADVGSLEWWQEQKIYRLDAAVDDAMRKGAQFKSHLNRANTQEAAGILMEGARQEKEKLLQLKREYRLQEYDSKTRRISANASMVSASASAQDADTRAKGAGAPGPEGDNTLYDPTTGKPVLSKNGMPQVIPGTAAQVQDFRIRQEGTKEIIEGMKELRDLQKRAGKITGGKWIFNSNVEHRAKALHTKIKLGLAKEASGLSYTDRQAQEIGEQMPLETLFVGDTDATIQDRLEERIRSGETAARTRGLHWDVREMSSRLGPQGESADNQDGGPSRQVGRLIGTAQAPVDELGEAGVSKFVQDLESLDKRLKVNANAIGPVTNAQKALQAGMAMAEKLDGANRKAEAFQVRNAMGKLAKKVQAVNEKRRALKGSDSWLRDSALDEIPLDVTPEQFTPETVE